MLDKATFQDQQLVVLAMAEGFIKKSDPELAGFTINTLTSLWSNLVPDSYEECAVHLMTACTMIGYILWEYSDETDFVVNEYRERILSSPGGLLGDEPSLGGDWDEDYLDEGL
jgi:hypothetical protein